MGLTKSTFSDNPTSRYGIDYQASDTSTITSIKGKMLIVWKKLDGQWEIYLHMWH